LRGYSRFLLRLTGDFVLSLWGNCGKLAFLACFSGFLVFSMFWGVLVIFGVFGVFEVLGVLWLFGVFCISVMFGFGVVRSFVVFVVVFCYCVMVFWWVSVFFFWVWGFCVCGVLVWIRRRFGVFMCYWCFCGCVWVCGIVVLGYFSGIFDVLGGFGFVVVWVVLCIFLLFSIFGLVRYGILTVLGYLFCNW